MSKKTKNQHFVPQLLLRNFANSDELVSIYDSTRDVLRGPTKVKRVLAENYLYDKDNVVENFLRDHVEGPASPAITKLLSSPTEVSYEPDIDVLRFISVQLNRTPHAVSYATEFANNFARTVFQRFGELNGLDSEAVNKLRLEFLDPQKLLARLTIESTLFWPILEDLRTHLLINETSEKYVISDHPAVHYNWYLRSSNDVAYTSLTSCGVQIFLPLSHSVTLCLYDSNIYRMGEQGKNYSYVDNLSDIRMLNQMQLQNRMSYVVFTDIESGEAIRSQCQDTPAQSLHSSHAWSSAPKENGEGKVKTTHAVWQTQADFKKWLSVCHIHPTLSSIPANCYDRKPEVVKAHKMFVDKARGRANAL